VGLGAKPAIGFGAGGFKGFGSLKAEGDVGAVDQDELLLQKALEESLASAPQQGPSDGEPPALKSFTPPKGGFKGFTGFAQFSSPSSADASLPSSVDAATPDQEANGADAANAQPASSAAAAPPAAAAAATAAINTARRARKCCCSVGKGGVLWDDGSITFWGKVRFDCVAA
jgi:hypothetical protein